MPVAKKMEEILEVDRVWRGPSSSRKDMFHYTFLHKPDKLGPDGEVRRGKIACTCEGFRYKGRCWHYEAVLNILGDEYEEDDISVSL